MKNSKKWLLMVALVGVFGLTACQNEEAANTSKDSNMSEKTSEEKSMKEESKDGMKDEAAMTTYKGDFVGKDHDVSGSVEITNEVTFKNFSIETAPAIAVYLTKDDDVKTGVRLGDLKSETGDQSYAVPADIGFDDYNRVTIYCEDVNVVLASATISMQS